MTKTRAKGLQILARWGRCRRSNVTSEITGYLYWQTADWLVDCDYATTAGEYIAITEDGRARAATLS